MRAMRFPPCRVAFIFLLAAMPAIAFAASSVRLEDLTTTEVRDAIRAGKTTILVPIGGTEQNGPHMALGKHNRRVQMLSERIAHSLGNALVAPVLAYVPEGGIEPPTAHMRFAGTITVPSETFVRVLESAARSFRLHGFRDIVFLGDHGGYQRELKSVAERLNRGWARDAARAHALPEYYGVVETDYPQLLRARGFGNEEIGSHAGLADTALMLALDPALVRSDPLASRNFDRADGVTGDPRRATPELGRLGVELIVAQTTDAIRKAARR
jgi:creatinine amidohydrolase/Fe(II)-dependent formamide hydrolase-like protein